MWAKLVIETNKYAEQERLKSPLHICSEIDTLYVQTMKAFIGLCFCMGITRKPKIADHWKQKFGLFRSQVNTIMSRDRFQLIWRYLHLYDSELLPQLGQPDKLLKLR